MQWATRDRRDGEPERCKTPPVYWVQICRPDWTGRGVREGQPPKPNNMLACSRHLHAAIRSVSKAVNPRYEVLTVKRKMVSQRVLRDEIIEVEIWV